MVGACLSCLMLSSCGNSGNNDTIVETEVVEAVEENLPTDEVVQKAIVDYPTLIAEKQMAAFKGDKEAKQFVEEHRLGYEPWTYAGNIGNSWLFLNDGRTKLLDFRPEEKYASRCIDLFEAVDMFYCVGSWAVKNNKLYLLYNNGGCGAFCMDFACYYDPKCDSFLAKDKFVELAHSFQIEFNNDTTELVMRERWLVEEGMCTADNVYDCHITTMAIAQGKSSGKDDGYLSSDLRAYGLKGKVKRVVYSDKNAVAFNEKGQIFSIKSNEGTYGEIEHDQQGRIKHVTFTPKEYWQLMGFDYEYDVKGNMTKFSQSGGEFFFSFEYGNFKDGLPYCENCEWGSEGFFGGHVADFEYTLFDDHGNWTVRIAKGTQANGEETGDEPIYEDNKPYSNRLERTIYYY